MSGRQAILIHLQSGKGITQIEATSLYGVTRLSAVIFDLKKLGYKIESIKRKGVTRYGKSCNYCEYRLIP